MEPRSGNQIDLSSPASSPHSEQRPEGRKFLGVHFACCDAYARIYANSTHTAYVGHCPRCVKRVEFKIGPGGTSSRFFTAR